MPRLIPYEMPYLLRCNKILHIQTFWDFDKHKDIIKDWACKGKHVHVITSDHESRCQEGQTFARLKKNTSPHCRLVIVDMKFMHDIKILDQVLREDDAKSLKSSCPACWRSLFNFRNMSNKYINYF